MCSTLESVVFRKVTIADSASLSDAVNVQGYDVVALQHPANTEGTAYTFQGSLDGETYVDMYSSTGAELSITKSATLAQCIQLAIAAASATPEPVKEFKGLQSLKVRTGTSASPTTQTGAATILVGLRKIN